MLGRGMELFRNYAFALFKGRHFDRAIIILWYCSISSTSAACAI